MKNWHWRTMYHWSGLDHLLHFKGIFNSKMISEKFIPSEWEFFFQFFFNLSDFEFFLKKREFSFKSFLMKKFFIKLEKLFFLLVVESRWTRKYLELKDDSKNPTFADMQHEINIWVSVESFQYFAKFKFVVNTSCDQSSSSCERYLHLSIVS